MQYVDRSAEMRDMSVPHSWRKNAVIILESATDLKFVANADGNVLKMKERKWYRINNPTVHGIQEIVVAEHSTIEKPVKIAAKVFYPDGTSWQLYPGNISEYPRDYSDTVDKAFFIPKYQKDALIFLEITREVTRPEFVGRFLLRDEYSLLKRSITLKHPENADLVYGLENGEDLDADEMTEVVGGQKITRITATRLANFREKVRTHFPEDYYAALYVSLPPKGLSSYSWQQLGDHYLELSAEAFTISKEVEELAGAIADNVPKEEKVRDSFETVVGNIRYHGDWTNGHAFVPRQAKTVLKNGYGDCKELSTILKSMLGLKKIESYPVLLATWGKDQPLEKYPYLDSFNHMILSVKDDGGQLKFLDGTHSWADAGSSYYPSVGRKALVIEPNNSRLLVIPDNDDFENSVRTSTVVEQNGSQESWIIQGEIDLIGYPALRFYERLQESSRKDANRLARELLEESFEIFAKDIAVSKATAKIVSVSYTADFKENYVSLGDGGFKLSIPVLYKSEVNPDLPDKLGPVYLPKFSQQDRWQLPFVPKDSELPSYSTTLADSTWEIEGQTVVRRYSQAMNRKEKVDMSVRELDMHLGALKNSMIWR